jgi:2-octaprenyl-6-methoxyphenol hydroxylase
MGPSGVGSGTPVVDIAIIGGGLSGLAAAVALAGPAVRTPLNVVLIDAGDAGARRDASFDGRASAITLASRRMFEALDVWPQLVPHAQPMREIIVTDAPLGAATRPALLHFGEPAADNEYAAWMIENRHLLATLYDAVSAAPDITVRPHTRVDGFDFPGAAAELRLDGGDTLRARLVVAADGRWSPTRKAAGIETVGWSYGQSGIVTTVEHEGDHGGRAEEHFLPAGPFAILPLTGRRASLVWTEEEAEAERLVALDEPEFTAELQRRFGSHLGRVRPIGPRHAYPLSLHIAKSFVAPRLALIGDAAHVVHPIAGLGLNLGFRDIAALAETTADTLRLGLDHGGLATLERYQAWRRLDTVLVAGMTDGLNRLFSNDNTALRLVRDLGLGLVDRIDPLKGFFMDEAAGLHRRLPKLLTGEPV